MNNLTSTFYNNMSYKLHFESGYLFEGGFVILQIKPEFTLAFRIVFLGFSKIEYVVSLKPSYFINYISQLCKTIYQMKAN